MRSVLLDAWSIRRQSRAVKERMGVRAAVKAAIRAAVRAAARTARSSARSFMALVRSVLSRRRTLMVN
jgi:hypothetical protein